MAEVTRDWTQTIGLRSRSTALGTSRLHQQFALRLRFLLTLHCLRTRLLRALLALKPVKEEQHPVGQSGDQQMPLQRSDHFLLQQLQLQLGTALAGGLREGGESDRHWLLRITTNQLPYAKLGGDQHADGSKRLKFAALCGIHLRQIAVQDRHSDMERYSVQ